MSIGSVLNIELAGSCSLVYIPRQKNKTHQSTGIYEPSGIAVFQRAERKVIASFTVLTETATRWCLRISLRFDLYLTHRVHIVQSVVLFKYKHSVLASLFQLRSIKVPIQIIRLGSRYQPHKFINPKSSPSYLRKAFHTKGSF